ncbi:MAG: hypothetical protein LBQ66_13875 [Planctomycetaceae bacterium]|nr:hypothetical protein [Planctomycetaceae bacterium]
MFFYLVEAGRLEALDLVIPHKFAAKRRVLERGRDVRVPVRAATRQLSAVPTLACWFCRCIFRPRCWRVRRRYSPRKPGCRLPTLRYRLANGCLPYDH